MSSYLLLRNNKESGPFSIEEIKGMSLKAYDLIWVVGKSAAWRYPGEITELKSFAPVVPEQNTEVKKPKSDQINKARTGSIYVNLPAGKTVVSQPPARMLNDDLPALANIPEPVYDFSDLYHKKPARSVRYSGKVLWVSTILLLFGAGILTGFFISDRRKFFTSGANHTQNENEIRAGITQKKREILQPAIPKNPNVISYGLNPAKTDTIHQVAAPVSKKAIPVSGKKFLKGSPLRKDTIINANNDLTSIRYNDSLKQITLSKNELLYQKIKSHPENYVNLVTGRYSTGVFGGISSFPVTVTNNSPVLMDLVVVNIDYIQNNDKVYKTESLTFNDLEPGETVTIKAPKSSRGIKISTRIRVVNSRQLDLSYSN